MAPVVARYQAAIEALLQQTPAGGDWAPLNVNSFFRREITECSITALLGPQIFELNGGSGEGGFLDAFWRYDEVVFALTLGFPRWISPKPYRVQERYLGMIEKYLDHAWAGFDWNGSLSEASWEPNFGARVCREIAKWLKDAGFRDQVAAGALGTLVFAYVLLPYLHLFSGLGRD